MLSSAHEKQHEFLDRLARSLEKKRDSWEQWGDTIQFFQGPYLRHVADEEKTLFTRIDSPTLIAGLVRDHARQAALWDQAKECFEARDADMIRLLFRSLIQNHTAHNELEDSNFPQLLHGLTAETLDTMRGEMRARRD